MTCLLSSLPAFERAILFVAAKEDATVEPWHDEKRELPRRAGPS
jgi:hypothetical protein